MEMLIIVALAAGAMFLLTSRQRKQQREARDKMASIAPGQEVLTITGLYATVVDVDAETDTLILEIAPGVHTRWIRGGIRSVVTPEVEELDQVEGASISSDAVDEQVEDVVVPDDLSGLSDPVVDLDKDRRPRREDGDEDPK